MTGFCISGTAVLHRLKFCAMNISAAHLAEKCSPYWNQIILVSDFQSSIRSASSFIWILPVFRYLMFEPCDQSVLDFLLVGINSFATINSGKLSSRRFISSLLKFFLAGIWLAFSLMVAYIYLIYKIYIYIYIYIYTRKWTPKYK